MHHKLRTVFLFSKWRVIKYMILKNGFLSQTAADHSKGQHQNAKMFHFTVEHMATTLLLLAREFLLLTYTSKYSKK